jgi:hypothetical protein
MIFKHAQNWRTSHLPYSLALWNTVNTGGSFNTPSGAIRNTKWWAERGFQGYGPKIQYPGGAGMDGMGCGCGCGGGCGHHGGDMSGVLCIAALAGVVYLLCSRRVGM